MSHGGAPTAQAVAGGPRSAPPPAQGDRTEKRDLASWWRNFKRSDKKPQEQQVPLGIFGVPLQQSIRYANVAISLLNDEGQSYIYGYVPIVVAKCGVFLKEKATDVEGIFRLAGSEKRIKELKIAFDSPDRYGKGLDWTGYTVHDAANILRRYFNQLPEPIIPLDFYDRFRDPLRNHQAQAVGAIEAQSPSVGEFDPDKAIRIYQNLITELPPLNRQLLLYILDLLAVFASKSDLNKMTTPNLSAIFQPGILSHPQHDMAPPEYRLSQDVLIFLIENQDNFLIGMQGTAVDQETVKEVQSGVPTPTKTPSTPTTPGRSKTIIGRSSSSASAGAESVRKFGSIRRNVSVSSSKNSKKSENGPTVIAATVQSPSTPTGGVHRSNTVPSRKGGSNAASPRFSREKNSDPSTPNDKAPPAAIDTSKPKEESIQSTPVAPAAPQLPVGPHVTSGSSSEATTPVAAVASDTSSAMNREYQTPRKDTTPLLSPPAGSPEPNVERSASYTPSAASGGGFLGIFKQSPTSDNEGRKPNKLQKRRIPGSSLSSAQSSNQSLERQESPKSPTATAVSPTVTSDLDEKTVEPATFTTPPTAPSNEQAVQGTTSRDSTGATLRPTSSPTHSYHSNTDLSDADMVGEDEPKDQTAQPEKEKKRHRWRFSRSQNKFDSPTPQQSPSAQNAMAAREQTTSRSTLGSNSGQPRRSFQEPTPITPSTTDPSSGSPMQQSQGVQPSSTDPAVFSDSEREKRSGPMSWLRGKMKDHKDKEAEKRARTPDRNRDQRESKQDLQLPAEGMPVRGKSFEQQRAASGTSPPAVVAAQQAAVNTATPVESSPESAAPASAVPIASTNGGDAPVDTSAATSTRDPASA